MVKILEKHFDELIWVDSASKSQLREFYRHFSAYHHWNRTNRRKQNKENSLSLGFGIGRLIDEWYKLGFKSSGWKRLKPEMTMLKQVTDLRNGIMHRGETPKITKVEARAMLTAVTKFIRNGENELE